MTKSLQPILPAAVKNAEFARTTYSAVLAEGITLSDVQKSEFWTHLSPKLQQWDRIEVIAEDGSFFAELLVSRVDANSQGTRTIRTPRVVLLQDVSLTPKSDADDAEDGVPAGYSVAYGGPKYKWRVLQDGVTDPLADGMSKAAAIKWAQERVAEAV